MTKSNRNFLSLKQWKRRYWQ